MRVNIIDGDSILYIVLHNKKGEAEKNFDECKKQLDSFLQNLFRLTNCSHYIIYLTVKQGFRYKINPGYKANRKNLTKPLYFNELREYFINHWKAVYDDWLEADDLCVTARSYCSLKGIESIISSPDKDLKHFGGIVYDYKKDEWVNTNQEDADEYFWVSLISGDQSDGVSGIPKRGEAYANKVFHDSDGKLLPQLSGIVLQEYIKHYGEYKGIQEYTKNYLSLKLVDTPSETFKLEPIPVPEYVQTVSIEHLFTEN